MTPETQSKLNICRFSFSEHIIWTEPLRGTIPLTDKEIADNFAIGGLRNTADSVNRLHIVRNFGSKLGAALMQMIRKNYAEHRRNGTIKESWVTITCDAVGSSIEACGPPQSAIKAVKALIAEYAKLSGHDIQVHSRMYPARTKIDAQLLEAWRLAAGDPDHRVYKRR